MEDDAVADWCSPALFPKLVTECTFMISHKTLETDQYQQAPLNYLGPPC